MTENPDARASGFVWFTWRYGVRARVVVAADEVRVVNVLRVHHVPFELMAGMRPGPGAARLVLTDGRELNA